MNGHFAGFFGHFCALFTGGKQRLRLIRLARKGEKHRIGLFRPGSKAAGAGRQYRHLYMVRPAEHCTLEPHSEKPVDPGVNFSCFVLSRTTPTSSSSNPSGASASISRVSLIFAPLAR
jgi:hypothetical protein